MTGGKTEDDDDQSSFDSDIDVGKVRRRFNELLDDALSLYETHRSSHHEPPITESKKNYDLRSQSAAHFRYLIYPQPASNKPPHYTTNRYLYE